MRTMIAIVIALALAAPLAAQQIEIRIRATRCPAGWEMVRTAPADPLMYLVRVAGMDDVELTRAEIVTAYTSAGVFLQARLTQALTAGTLVRAKPQTPTEIVCTFRPV